MKGKETTKIKITKSRKLKIDRYQHGNKKRTNIIKIKKAKPKLKLKF